MAISFKDIKIWQNKLNVGNVFTTLSATDSLSVVSWKNITHRYTRRMHQELNEKQLGIKNVWI